MKAFEILLHVIEVCKYALGLKVPYPRPPGMSAGEQGDRSSLTFYSPSWILSCAADLLGLQELRGGSARLWELGCVFWRLTRHWALNSLIFIQSRSCMYPPSFGAAAVMIVTSGTGLNAAFVPVFIFGSEFHRITESQNSRGWKGPLWVI